MGNPHAISFDEPLDPSHADRLGPLVSRGFPEGTNVELARRTGEDAFDLGVWEGVVGRPRACGTGAAATAVPALRVQPARSRLWGGEVRTLPGAQDARRPGSCTTLTEQHIRSNLTRLSTIRHDLTGGVDSG